LGGCEQTKKSDIVSGSSKHVDSLNQQTSPSIEIESDDDKGLNGNGVNANNPNDRTVDETGTTKENYSTGFVKSDQRREAVHINLGMALKACATALNSGDPKQYIPYANSKLTILLSSALGGNSKTSAIVCCSQEKFLTTETITTI